MHERESPGGPGSHSRWVWLLGLSLLYVAIAAIFATERTLIYPWEPTEPSWSIFFSMSLASWTAWLFLTPLVVHLARRYPLEGAQAKRSRLVHLGAAIAISPLQAYLNIYIGVVFSILAWQYRPTWRELLTLAHPLVLSHSIRNPLIYAVIVGITLTVDYYRKYKDREIKAAQLESQLSRARLQALQSQIHPHFLFNTLNAVTALMRQDVEAAEKMLVRLADLLRLTLKGGDTQEIPLRQELKLLDAYLGIERVRFSDRLQVVQEADPETLEEPVPRLILQPLVENAVRHGLAPKRGPGTIWIRARRHEGALELAVCDDGVGLSAAGEMTGLGLANTRARLAALYGDGAGLQVAARPEGGTCAAIRIPWPAPAEGTRDEDVSGAEEEAQP